MSNFNDLIQSFLNNNATFFCYLCTFIKNYNINKNIKSLNGYKYKIILIYNSI